MKGIVFTEFLEWAEKRFSPELVDRTIQHADLPGGGAYTSVGTYDHHELLKLVGCMGKLAEVSPPDLLREFGTHLFKRFYENYPRFFNGVQNTFDFLENVDSYIHVEVRKLYPDAELPRFVRRRRTDGGLEMEYHSERQLADLAEGLMIGCAGHFGETLDVVRHDEPGQRGFRTQFVLFHGVGAAS